MKIAIVVSTAVVMTACLLATPASAGTCTSPCIVAGGEAQVTLDASTGSNWELETASNGSQFRIGIDGSTVEPFRIEAGAGSNLLFLDAAERIGINTSAPGYTLSIVGNRIQLKNGVRDIQMRADGTDTDINAFGANLFLRSVTAGKNIIINPFTNDGLVGVGTTTPTEKLDVVGNTSFTLQVRNSSLTTGTRAMVRVLNRGASLFRFDNLTTNNRWLFGGGNADGVLIQKIGVSGNRMFLDANGDMTIAGAYFSGSSRAIKTDISPVDTGDILERVARLPVSRWAYKGKPDMPHMGPMAEDFHELFGVGPDNGIASLDGSGVALAAIKGLYGRLVALEADKAQLEAELIELRALVASQSQ